MTFHDDLKRFTDKVDREYRALFQNVAVATHASIQSGSPVTGAPGQPVDTAYLKNSWLLEFEGPLVAQISTNVAYAPVIEENNRAAYDERGVERPPGLPGQGAGGRHIKSLVGGHHSVRLTRAGFPRIIEEETRRFREH